MMHRLVPALLWNLFPAEAFFWFFAFFFLSNLFQRGRMQSCPRLVAFGRVSAFRLRVSLLARSAYTGLHPHVNLLQEMLIILCN